MKYSEYKKKLEQDQEYRAAKEELQMAFALGSAVLRARLRKGWTQSELAKLIGTKQANISRIEAGLSNPTLNMVDKLFRILDLELRIQPQGSHELIRTITIPALPPQLPSPSPGIVPPFVIKSQMTRWETYSIVQFSPEGFVQ
jgi:HTH-type transcriptional regulator / antitoxin HipB